MPATHAGNARTGTGSGRKKMAPISPMLPKDARESASPMRKGKKRSLRGYGKFGVGWFGPVRRPNAGPRATAAARSLNLMLISLVWIKPSSSPHARPASARGSGGRPLNLLSDLKNISRPPFGLLVSLGLARIVKKQIFEY